MRSHSQSFEAQRWSERSERPLCSVIHISIIITTAILSSAASSGPLMDDGLLCAHGRKSTNEDDDDDVDCVCVFLFM